MNIMYLLYTYTKHSHPGRHVYCAVRYINLACYFVDVLDIYSFDYLIFNNSQ